MNILFIREMDIVPDLVNLHPAMIIPSKTNPEISDWVRIADTAAITFNNWFNDIPVGLKLPNRGGI